MKAIRWGDNDHYWGPFTWHPGDYVRYGVILHSAGGDEGRPYLRLHFRKQTLCIAMPGWLIKPHREKKYPVDWTDGSEVVQRLGRNWYWDYDRRSYGFQLSTSGTIGRHCDFLQVYLGREGGSMMDSSIEQRWSYFLPWTQWRHVRVSYYDPDGRHVRTIYDRDYPRGADGLGGIRMGKYDDMRQAEDACPKAEFTFEDFDGEVLKATTHIEEREWWRGVGWFKWLAWLWPAKVHRSLVIMFSDEVGPKKGSWKGGIIGTSIEMRRDDTPLTAFMRHCRENGLIWRGWPDSDMEWQQVGLPKLQALEAERAKNWAEQQESDRRGNTGSSAGSGA